MNALGLASLLNMQMTIFFFISSQSRRLSFDMSSIYFKLCKAEKKDQKDPPIYRDPSPLCDFSHSIKEVIQIYV